MQWLDRHLLKRVDGVLKDADAGEVDSKQDPSRNVFLDQEQDGERDGGHLYLEAIADLLLGKPLCGKEAMAVSFGAKMEVQARLKAVCNIVDLFLMLSPVNQIQKQDQKLSVLAAVRCYNDCFFLARQFIQFCEALMDQVAQLKENETSFQHVCAQIPIFSAPEIVRQKLVLEACTSLRQEGDACVRKLLSMQKGRIARDMKQIWTIVEQVQRGGQGSIEWAIKESSAIIGETISVHGAADLKQPQK